MNSLCSFQLAFTFSFYTQWPAWIKAPSNRKRKIKSIYTIPLLFMFPTRTNINRLEINEISKFSLTALLIEKQTSFVQKHSRETLLLHSVNCFALHLEQLSSFVSMLQKVWSHFFSWQRRLRRKKGFSQNRNPDDRINF